MDASRDLVRQGLVHHPVALRPGFACEIRRNNFDMEMGFPGGARLGVPLMQMGLIRDL